jgi:nucleotide-binding universal stress UspA family protein
MKIVLSGQGSSEYRAARDWCFEHLDATSSVVAVVGVSTLGDFVMGLPMFDLLDATEGVVAEMDREVCQPLSALGVSCRTQVVSTGQAHALAAIAEREHADMIVIGKVPHGPLSDVLRSETASHLAHRPPCPVLIVPAHPGLEAAHAHSAPRGRAIS